MPKSKVWYHFFLAFSLIFNGSHFPTFLHHLRTNPPGLVITVHLGLSRTIPEN